MRNILLVDNGRHLGGGQVIASHIIDSVINTDYQIDVGCDVNSTFWKLVKSKYQNVRLYHIEELRLTKGKKNALDFFRIISYLIRNLFYGLSVIKRYDLVYINSTRSIFTIGVSCALSRTPFVIHIHLIHKPLELAIIGIFSRLKICKHVIACSELVENNLKEICGSKVLTICNSLHQSYSRKTITKSRRIPRRVGFFGDLSIEKGFDIFLAVASRLPEISFFAAGTASTYSLALNDSLPMNVSLLASVNDLPQLIEELDISIVLVPSRVSESFGMVAVESVAAGCMVLVSGKGYLRVLASELQLYVCDGIDQYVEHIQTLFNLDNKEFFDMVLHSQNSVKDKYSFDKFQKNILCTIIDSC
jgi:glycosyltransferase involved in cell wall biosynthesis